MKGCLLSRQVPARAVHRSPAQTGAAVFSFDLSNAVEANAKNNGHMSNLNLFQGSIYEIPVREGIFDKVFAWACCSNTPDPERSFLGLVRFLKPRGEIAVDVYGAQPTLAVKLESCFADHEPACTRTACFAVCSAP